MTENQTTRSVEKNASFFRDNLDQYNDSVQELDSYAIIRRFLNDELKGIGSLLDIGNGGVFDYDTKLIARITALDLFLDKLPPNYVCPANVTLKTGSALDIPFPDESFDAVAMVMLIHHLVGKSVAESRRNVARAIAESARVLKPGGRLIILESCVPQWFYLFERIVFPVACPLINALLPHPATIQYPPAVIAAQIAAGNFERTAVKTIPKGRWMLQFGYKFPAALTPACPHLITGFKKS